MHAVAVAQVEAWLTIKAQVGDFLFAPQHDFNLHRIRHHQRSMGQRMRRNRCNHKSFHGWHEHGAASGKRIRRRTGGRRHNHSIRPITGHERLIDVEVVGIQAGERCLIHHGIIKNKVAAANLVFPQQINLHE